MEPIPRTHEYKSPEPPVPMIVQRAEIVTTWDYQRGMPVAIRGTVEGYLLTEAIEGDKTPHPHKVVIDPKDVVIRGGDGRRYQLLEITE